MIRTIPNPLRIGLMALGLAVPGTAAEAAMGDQVEPAVISANRPGFGETADVTGRGILQFESGVIFDGDRESGVGTTTMSAPVSLLRLGIARRVELQAASEGMLSRHVAAPTGGGRVSGHADIDFGLKVKLATEADAGINVAVLGSVNVPLGARDFSSGSYDPGLKVAFGRSLHAGVSVGANVQVASTTVAGKRVLQQALSAAAARAFSDEWSVFGEVYRVTTATGAAATTSVDAGLSRLIGSNLQVDASVGRGLSRSATDWFVAFGFAVRHTNMFGKPTARP